MDVSKINEYYRNKQHHFIFFNIIYNFRASTAIDEFIYMFLNLNFFTRVAENLVWYNRQSYRLRTIVTTIIRREKILCT